MGTNSIIYLKQTLPSRGLPLNCYAKASTTFPLRELPFLIKSTVGSLNETFLPTGQNIPECGPLSLDDCRAALLSPSHILISTKSGNFYLLTLLLETATHTVTQLILTEAGRYAPAETVSLHYCVLANYLICVPQLATNFTTFLYFS